MALKRDGLWGLWAQKASRSVQPNLPLNGKPFTCAGNAADAYTSPASRRARATNPGTPSAISANHGSASLPARYRA